MELSILQIKILNYICKNPIVLVDQLMKYFNLSKEDLTANLVVLRNLDLIEKDCNFRGYVYPTFKGKNYFKSFIQNWLYNNFLAIIAIIISIIALFK